MGKHRNKVDYVVGIDEVGRGALAGPVTVAAVAAPINLKFKIKNGPSGDSLRAKTKLKLKDSKKLSTRQREIWFDYITHQRQSLICYCIANVSPKIIDRINISQAANLAAARAFNRLIKNKKNLASINGNKVFLDGGLYLSKSLNSKFYVLNSIAKGDEKIPVIMLASIAAKVMRDRRMKKLHKRYPKYDFINNVGYGTKKHRKAIKKHGRLSIHRKSFKIK